MSWNIVFFSLLLIVVAIMTKIIGCGIGARLTGFSREDSIKIGIGMVSRGEVALIVANKGAAVGLIREEYFAPIIIVVLVTTLITPILLKLAYKGKKRKYSECCFATLIIKISDICSRFFARKCTLKTIKL